MDPYDLLVEDCWLHLFQFVSAEDKQALCLTCGAFQAMLEPEKVKWGLELVLPYILKEFNNSYYYRWPNKILKSALDLRRVCKAWREGFDRFIVNGSYSLREEIKRKYHFGGSHDEYFLNIPAAEKFVTFFKDYSGNPFIGRIVSIYATFIGVDEPQPGNQEGNSENENTQVNEEDNEASKNVEVEEETQQETDGEVNEGESEHEIEEEDDDEEEYWQAYEERQRRARMARRERALKNREMVMELLSKFGEEIDHLYYGKRYNCTPLEAYKLLQIVLCNCLNLQSLEVQLRYLYEAREIGFQKQLEEYFEMNPLPKMHRLRELKLCAMNAHLEKLMLEACGSNLQKLERQNSSEIPVSVWGNMKCLRHLTMLNCRFEQMETLLRAINSPLEVLILDQISFDDEKEHFKIDKFLLAIQHLPLKDVQVFRGGTLKESEPFPDDFPKHKTISNVSIEVDVFSPNFLQFLPELQSFFVNGAECLWKPLFSK